MENFIILLLLVLIIGGIMFYIVKVKKKGEKCIGCPHCKNCNSECGGKCSHSSKTKQ